MFEDHSVKEGSVIISPSLWEGADLKGDLAEFLVIAKVPYPTFNDPIIQGLMQIDKNRYYEDCVMKIRQGVGRVIRSVEDEADIYITDAAFKTIYRYNRGLFPEDFQSRVVNV